MLNLQWCHDRKEERSFSERSRSFEFNNTVVDCINSFGYAQNFLDAPSNKRATRVHNEENDTGSNDDEEEMDEEEEEEEEGEEEEEEDGGTS